MKNVMLILLLFVCMLIPKFGLHAKNESDNWPKINWKYVYFSGQPDKRGVCVGTGVCRIEWTFDITWEMVAQGGGNVIDDVTITRDDTGAMILSFSKDKLSQQDIMAQFSGERKVFQLATNTPVPQEIVQLLQLRPDYSIQAGSYPVQESITHYTVFVNR